MRILLIDDDEEEYLLLEEMVSRTPKGEALLGFDLDWVSTYEQALGALSDCTYDVYLVDYRLGARSGLDLLRVGGSPGLFRADHHLHGARRLCRRHGGDAARRG